MKMKKKQQEQNNAVHIPNRGKCMIHLVATGSDTLEKPMHAESAHNVEVKENS